MAKKTFVTKMQYSKSSILPANNISLDLKKLQAQLLEYVFGKRED